MSKLNIFTLAIAAAALAIPATAHAQAAPGTPPAAYQEQMPATPGTAAVDDVKLQQFAQVHQQVEAVGTQYQAQIAQTADIDQQSALAAEANQQMMKTVEASPLSVQEYNQIAMLVQQDPALQQKYSQMLGR